MTCFRAMSLHYVEHITCRSDIMLSLLILSPVTKYIEKGKQAESIDTVLDHTYS